MDRKPTLSVIEHFLSHGELLMKRPKTKERNRDEYQLLLLRDEIFKQPLPILNRAFGRNDSVVLFPLPKSFTCPQKSLKVGQSDIANRPRLHNGSGALSTPSSTAQTTSSLPLRHPSAPLRPRIVADCIPSYPACSPSTPSEPCPDPRRDVNMVVADAILSLQRVVVPVAKFGKAGH